MDGLDVLRLLLRHNPRLSKDERKGVRGLRWRLQEGSWHECAHCKRCGRGRVWPRPTVHKWVLILHGRAKLFFQLLSSLVTGQLLRTATRPAATKGFGLSWGPALQSVQTYPPTYPAKMKRLLEQGTQNARQAVSTVQVKLNIVKHLNRE